MMAGCSGIRSEIPYLVHHNEFAQNACGQLSKRASKLSRYSFMRKCITLVVQTGYHTATQCSDQKAYLLRRILVASMVCAPIGQEKGLLERAHLHFRRGSLRMLDFSYILQSWIHGKELSAFPGSLKFKKAICWMQGLGSKEKEFTFIGGAMKCL
ncbi:hypothetical protein AVEN_96676-1 [Araneus ventricosus]|uniref:Uncharacterized protein n=1 Tax=Araneus ventricosus TaxID=182803 RepID=A0A4Y2E7H7_ARAVE|nr:hypothetical protein AVEN_96676-1 [Araneus ventricosus]